MDDADYQPVIIIGAPRSGTNMLRDILCQLPGTGTWPCDEINYIWRHKNVKFASDEFTSDMASPELKRYIRREFDIIAQKYELDTVVEKTCANSMRVGFVDRLLPEAKYIFIVRDGLDVVGSALLRWEAKLDIPYLFKKARYVPISDLPYYASRYLYNRAYRVFSKTGQLAFWGPQMEGIDQLLIRYSLPQVCALQWQACVNNAQRDFDQKKDSRYMMLNYESLVSQPDVNIERVARFINKPITLDESRKLTESVSSRSVGKGRASLSRTDLNSILPLIEGTLERYGYKG